MNTTTSPVNWKVFPSPEKSVPVTCKSENGSMNSEDIDIVVSDAKKDNIFYQKVTCGSEVQTDAPVRAQALPILCKIRLQHFSKGHDNICSANLTCGSQNETDALDRIQKLPILCKIRIKRHEEKSCFDPKSSEKNTKNQFDIVQLNENENCSEAVDLMGVFNSVQYKPMPTIEELWSIIVSQDRELDLVNKITKDQEQSMMTPNEDQPSGDEWFHHL